MWTLSFPHPLIFWSTLVIQLLGVLSIVAVRLCASDRGRSTCRRCFLVSLLALGFITVVAVAADSDSWVTSGASLSVITVFATFDFRGERAHSAAF